MSNSPYAAAPKEKLDEIIRLAEARIAAQLTAAIAADQRAMTFASFLAAVEGAAIAGLAAIKTSGLTRVSLIVMVVGFAVAALIALVAAQPVKMDFPGGRPNSWIKDDKVDGDPLHDARAAFAKYYDEMIVDNDELLEGNANLLRASLWAVIFTLVIAGGLAALGA